MQKPVLIRLAFLFFVSFLQACETYNPGQSQLHENQTNRLNQNYQKGKDTIYFQENEKNVEFPLELYLPQIFENEQVINKFAFTLSYNEEHEQPNWVAYTLKASYLRGKVKRTENFRQDFSVSTFSAELEDYKYSGYDRGHLVPAGDMKWSEVAMSETFLLSNISPQEHDFNAEIWEKLESAIRNWVKKDTVLHIVTGPVFMGNEKSIGKNKVTVPSYFYKAVLDADYPQYKSIAFLIPNKGSNRPFTDYAISVDSLEKVIKTDLFERLPDNIELEVEKHFSLKDWKAQAPNKKRKNKK